MQTTKTQLSGKALITGASGFIGGQLRDTLINQGTDVVSVRRPGSPPSRAGRSVEVDYADIDSLSDVLRQEKPDYIFHVAGATKGVRYTDFRHANVMPTFQLQQAAQRAYPELKRFVLVSSLAAYGPSHRNWRHDGDKEARPIEYYGQSKLEAERALQDEQRLAWTIMRPGGVYGPGDVDYFQLFKSIHSGLNVYFGNRDRLFSAVYVDDFVRALIDAATSPNTIGKGYFICDGSPVTWEGFQNQIIKTVGKRVRELDMPEFLVHLSALGGELLTKFDGKPRLFNRQKARMGAQEAWTCDHTKAREDFGYVPAVTMPEGVERTYEWYRKSGWL